MNKSFIKIRQHLRMPERPHRLETGFSMLEAVVVVGVLLALAVGGLLSSGPIVANVKMASAKSQASQIYTAIMVAQTDGDPSTNATYIVDEFNDSDSDWQAEIREAVAEPSVAAMSTNGYVPKSDNDFCVKITYKPNPKIFSEMGNCTAAPPVTTPTPEPTPEPTPTATRPADSSAAGTIDVKSGYASWYTDREVQGMVSDAKPTFGFALNGGSSVDPANYTVAFSGSPEIGVSPTQGATVLSGTSWYTSIAPDAGGFIEGIGYVTATVTDKTTGAVSMKSWQLTVTENVGMTQYTRSPDWWNAKTAASGASNEAPTFGFQITNAAASDYTVTFTGGENIGAAPVQTANYTNSYGAAWFSSIKPVAGGFTVGTGTITAVATHNKTGKSFTRDYQLTITEHIGMTQYARSPDWWNGKTAASGASNEFATFGFEITKAAESDYDVKFTGGENIGAAVTQTANYSNSYGAVWFSSIKPVAGGFTVGTGTITATATHKLTGKVYTRTYQLTIAEHAGMTQYARSPAWWNDKSVAAGSTAGQTFGFQITNAAASDYTVTITGGSEVNGTPAGPNYSSSYGAVWFSTVNPGAGGFQAGTSTITATATHKLTGKVYTKTYTLTVN